MLSPIERAAKAAWKPQDIREPWQWAEDHIEVDNTSPLPGKWRSANSPWVKEFMEVAANKMVSMIAVKCSAQSSKTISLLILLLWLIVEDPGPSMYVLANKDDAEDFVRDRFSPVLEKCKPANDLKLRETKLNFTFRTMPLYFVGAGSPAKLQGKPMKRLFLDEVRNYPTGALATVMKRVRAFGQLAQIFLISTPDKKDDAVDRAFLDGDQRTFHFPCPQCEAWQQLKFDQLKAEHPETHECIKWEDVPGAKVGEVWSFDTLAKAIRFQCYKCGHLISDTPAERKKICRSGKFIRMNPNAPAHHVSFTWNALLPWWVSWRSVVEEFIKAIEDARRGDTTALKTFINETLGESWEDKLGVIEDYGFLELRKTDYEYGEIWSEAKRKFMAADKQQRGGENYWYLIREFGSSGKSRLVAHGNVKTLAELEEKRKEYGVATQDAMIDSGYMAQEVYRFCISAGWKCFKGDHVQFYLVPIKNPKNPAQTIIVRQIWRKTTAIAYNETTRGRIGALPLFTFSNEASNNYLAEYMTGLVGEWTLPSQVEREYMKQIGGDVRKEHVDSKGAISYSWHTVGENHYRDCERMILIAAIATLTINAPVAPVKKPKTESPDVTDVSR
ncbi:MAG: hypothetical protein JWR19_2171 [Pedosphaera sp.]|nr:hypothetical protein [Pedosphaera sp.]